MSERRSRRKWFVVGYSAVPLYGKIAVDARSDDIWKIIDVLFKMTDKFPGVLFTYVTFSNDNLS